MVHPDKCRHPRAKDAFEVIGAAQKDLMDDDKRKGLDYVLGVARGKWDGNGSRERRRATYGRKFKKVEE